MGFEATGARSTAASRSWPGLAPKWCSERGGRVPDLRQRGVWLLGIGLAWACNAAPSVVALTDRDCPEGASVVGAAPPTGTLQRCELPGGVRHGRSRAWHENGRLRYETEWWRGVKHGAFTFWYPSGRRRAEGRDRHGVPDGKWTHWNEDGVVAQERVFEPPTAVAKGGAGPARTEAD